MSDKNINCCCVSAVARCEKDVGQWSTEGGWVMSATRYNFAMSMLESRK